MICPRITYPGGKSRLAPWLISHFPEPDTQYRQEGNCLIPTVTTRYCEPFAGRGNVYFRYRWECLHLRQEEFTSYRLNDYKTWRFFHYLKQYTPEQILKIVGYPNVSEEQFRQLCDDSESAKAVLLEPYVTFSGIGYPNRANRNAMGWNGKGSASIRPDGYLSVICSAASLLQSQPQTIITCLDAVEVVEKATADDFLYLDPPYPGANPGAYATDNTKMHVRLCSALRRTPARWLLSNYEVEPYTTLLGKPAAKRMTNQVMSPAGLGSKRNDREECLWKNY